MHYLLGFFFWFLTRGPLTIGAVAIAILGLGFYLQVGQNERNVERAAAIAAGPPPVFDIASYDADRDMTDQREVVVRAQASMSNRYRLTYSEDWGDDYAYMVPLLSTNATNEKIIFGVALYTSSDFTFDDITPDLMLNGAVGFGEIGPIMEINGRVQSLGKWQDMTDEAFAEKGMTLAANAVIMRPYLNGRASALAPQGRGIFEAFSYVAAALALLALAKLVLSGNKPATPKLRDPAAHEPAEVAMSAPVAAPQASAVPLWKQRSGLVEEAEFVDAPATFEPAQFANTFTEKSASQPALIAPRRSGFGVRKILIGIVGTLFVIGLVATISDLIAKSGSNDVAEIHSIEERLAEGAADVIVPDADPNRHWTDIDVSPIAEWFVAKFFLAIAGDSDAQITLGMIVGGLFVGMFMLRFFFMMRRTMQPKTTARFDSMGLN